jgi:hypothetical protein
MLVYQRVYVLVRNLMVTMIMFPRLAINGCNFGHVPWFLAWATPSILPWEPKHKWQMNPYENMPINSKHI